MVWHGLAWLGTTEPDGCPVTVDASGWHASVQAVLPIALALDGAAAALGWASE